MAPKKKPNKKGNEDWEAELGETVDPISTTIVEAKEVDQNGNEDGDELSLEGGGGLLAALKKNKSKKQKKGKAVEGDHLDGEESTEAPKNDEDGSGDEGGGLKSKKEKEKEKKEREKQRKKEQVCFVFPNTNFQG
jgi:translation initiation factor 5B